MNVTLRPRSGRSCLSTPSLSIWMLLSTLIHLMLKFLGAIGHKGKFLRLLHYHRTSGLAQTHEESVDTNNVHILNPSTATPKHVRCSHQISESSTSEANTMATMKVVDSYDAPQGGSRSTFVVKSGFQWSQITSSADSRQEAQVTIWSFNSSGTSAFVPPPPPLHISHVSRTCIEIHAGLMLL